MNKETLIDLTEQYATRIQSISDALWNHPEVSGEEKYAAELLRKTLSENGFTIKEVSNMEQAFYGEYGSGSPVIAILAEYDALKGLSQAVCAEKRPIKEGEPGHGCGHNLIAGASTGAAIAIKDYLEQSGRTGTIRLYGCPEEELLSGKGEMIHEHAFDGCELALAWHPMSFNGVWDDPFLANTSIRFYFQGTAAHASSSPHMGRSALDAVELMNVGANYLREHVIQEARIHYTTNSGGFPPNIVPPNADSWYFIRAPHRTDVDDITQRLIKIAEGAAMMTETTVQSKLISGCYEFNTNTVVSDITFDNLSRIPLPKYNEDEEKFAKALQATVPESQLRSELNELRIASDTMPTSMFNRYLAREESGIYKHCPSSDCGDVSFIMPMSFLSVACMPLGVVPHTWQAASSVGSGLGKKGMVYAMKVIAATAYDFFENPEYMIKAKSEFERKTHDKPYRYPLDPK